MVDEKREILREMFSMMVAQAGLRSEWERAIALRVTWMIDDGVSRRDIRKYLNDLVEEHGTRPKKEFPAGILPFIKIIEERYLQDKDGDILNSYFEEY